MGVVGALLFVLALLVSIVLHEAGHMWCARWSGGKVTEFFVGFGPRLWSFTRGETEYGVKAIPAGGYVKIVGMTDLDEIEPGDEDRALKNKPARKRLLTLSAGSLMHFLIALFIFAFVPMAWGTQQSTTSVGTIATCMVPSGTNAGATTGCTGAEKSPAAAAGLVVGDKITEVNGKKVTDATSLVDALHALPGGEPATITFTDTSGKTRTATVTPVSSNSVTETNGSTGKGSLIGISLGSATVHQNPIAAVKTSGDEFWTSIKDTFTGLASIPASIPKLFTSTVDHTQRSTSSPVGVVGMAEVSGTLYQQGGFGSVLLLVAEVNVFIGVFNLLPILPLDGGHIAILLYEEARKRICRLLRRPDPGRVDLNKMMPVAYGFLLFFVCLTVLLVAADVTNPIRLG
ncbi:RIP metalloprotease [Actinospica sp. MGRD01-02]|uniref:RIP metalloprotease n=1 Tax=Actinospica acidithermotolerans TaxID=2828514 RepID=A0A941IGP2_9ACTN|nr:RIP metalloprotease [Actinospica acidithermotolerans]MBR7824862.1 RIP metalloprotease [Actinospica acidithermotolerans]